MFHGASLKLLKWVIFDSVIQNIIGKAVPGYSV